MVQSVQNQDYTLTEALVMLLVTIALIIPAHALVAGIETVLFLILAAILGLIGKNMLKIGAPPKTMTTLKEDAEWAKQAAQEMRDAEMRYNRLQAPNRGTVPGDSP